MAKAELAMQRADELQWELALSARRIAKGEAKKLAGTPGASLGLDDLIDEGMIGLLRAARRFDPDRGIRFSTYARWWARAQITRTIDRTGHAVRLPSGVGELRRRIGKARHARIVMGQEAPIGDLADELGVTTERAQQVLGAIKATSLDQFIGDDPDGRTPYDMIAADHSREPDEHAAIVQLIARLEPLIRRLDDRTQYVLRLRFGLGGEEAHTLTEIGGKLGFSREYIRQIEQKGLKTLRGWLEPADTEGEGVESVEPQERRRHLLLRALELVQSGIVTVS